MAPGESMAPSAHASTAAPPERRSAWVAAARRRTDLANQYERDGRFAEALTLLQESRQLLDAAGEDAGAASAARECGRVRWLQGSWDHAAEDYRESVALLRRAGARTALAEALHDLGFVALARGRLGEAHECFEQASQCWEPRRGRIQLEDAPERPAESSVESSVEAAPAGNDLSQAGRNLALLGLTELLSGRRQDAHRRWEEAAAVLAGAPETDDDTEPGTDIAGDTAADVRRWVGEWIAYETARSAGRDVAGPTAPQPRPAGMA
jgi:tetratricopeptide (TPR) repeat protein